MKTLTRVWYYTSPGIWDRTAEFMQFTIQYGDQIRL